MCVLVEEGGGTTHVGRVVTRRVWATWVGDACGLRGWATRVGYVDGRRVWDTWVDYACELRGWEKRVGYVGGRSVMARPSTVAQSVRSEFVTPF